MRGLPLSFAYLNNQSMISPYVYPGTMESLEKQKQVPKPTFNEVVTAVEEHLDISRRNFLYTKSRKSLDVYARKLCLLLMRRYCGVSFIKIGNFLNKDEAQLSVQYRETLYMEQTNEKVREDVLAITLLLKNKWYKSG